MDPLTIAASVGNTAFNQYQQNRAFKKNKEWWNERFDKTNAYNSPAQQAARLRDAGLNKAMMYGGGQGGGQATSQSTEGYTAPESNLDQLSLMSTQVENLNADTKLKKQQSITEGFKGVSEDVDGQVKKDFAKTSAQLYQFELEIKRQNMFQETIETMYKEPQKQAAIWESIQRIEKMRVDMDYTKANTDYTKTKTLTEKAVAIIKAEEAKLAEDGIFLNQGQYSMYKEIIKSIIGSGGTEVLDTPDSELSPKKLRRKRNYQTTINSGKMADYGPKL